MNFIFCLLIFPFFLACSALADVPADFDGDGRSDLTFVRARGEKGPLEWRYQVEVGTAIDLPSFGRKGDLPILGRWMSADQVNVGVAIFNKERDEVEWRISDSTGRSQSIYLGDSKDLIVSGGDFNGSGVVDAAIAKLQNGRVRWTLRFDPFLDAGATAQSINVNFGKSGDRAFFASPDGISDWIGTVGKKGSRSLVRLKNVVTGEVRSSSRFGAFASTGPRPRPIPMRSPGGEDVLVFPIASSGNLTVVVTTLQGQRIWRRAFERAKEIVVGDFLTGSGEELAVRIGRSMRIFNVFDRAVSTHPALPGEAVDEIAIASSTGEGAAGNPFGHCSARSPFDGVEGFVWKPNSDTQYYAVVILPRSLTGDVRGVNVASASGQTITALRYKGIGNGGRTHWQDNRLTGAAYRAQFGSVIVVVHLDNGGCLTYRIPDPAARND